MHVSLGWGCEYGRVALSPEGIRCYGKMTIKGHSRQRKRLPVSKLENAISEEKKVLDQGQSQSFSIFQPPP
jgi:hypothetical protein